MSKTLPRADFEANVAALCDQKRATVEAVLRAAATVIRQATNGGYTVALPELGRFTQKTRAARTGRDIRTGAPIEIPAKQVLTFRPSPVKPG